MEKLKNIYDCLKFGLLPWWCYEEEKHYDCTYWQHLCLNMSEVWDLITNNKIMTKSEAIELGYEYCGYRDKDEQRIIKLKDLDQSHFDSVDDNIGPVVLGTLGGYKYKVSADEIRELVIDMLSVQDTVADEDGELCDLASEADYEQLAKDINERLSKKTYYDMTDIEVTL